MGPMTGRRAGCCAGFDVPGFANPGPRCGFGFHGRGHGWRNMFYATGLPGWMRAGYAPPAPEQELTALENEATWLKDQLDAISQRIEELGKK